MSEQITINIIEQLGKISARGNLTLELNIVSWNNNAPKFDIREWNDDHTKMTRGLTMTREEAQKLFEILREYFTE